MTCTGRQKEKWGLVVNFLRDVFSGSLFFSFVVSMGGGVDDGSCTIVVSSSLWV